jgi:hypothetical protein
MDKKYLMNGICFAFRGFDEEKNMFFFGVKSIH